MAEWADTTFFTLKRRERAVLFPVTVVFVLAMILIIALFVAINWATLSDFVRLAQQADESTSDAESLQFVGRILMLLGTFLLFLFPLYLVTAAYEATCLRWMIRGEAPGLFGMTIDRDTWRVYGVYWCWFLGQMALSIVVSLVMVPFTLATAVVGALPGPLTLGWAFLVQGALMLVQYAVTIFLAVRFAPAAAASIATNQFVFIRAWRVTQDKFWPLLGSFAALWLMGIIGFSIVWGAGAVSMIGGALLHPPPPGADGAEVLRWLASPTILAMFGLYAVLTSFLSMVLMLMNFGVNANTAQAAVEEGKIAAAA